MASAEEEIDRGESAGEIEVNIADEVTLMSMTKLQEIDGKSY